MRSLLRSLAWWVLNRWADPAADRLHAWAIIDRWPETEEDRQYARYLLSARQPAPSEVDWAIKSACLECGVNVHAVEEEFDPGGKRYEILHHAAVLLGNPLYTIGDIKRLLQ